MRKTISRMISLGIILVLITATAYLVYAAFSGTKRNLGSNTVFNNVTIAGGVNLGSLAADGSIKMKPTTSPPTCNSANEGTLYTNKGFPGNFWLGQALRLRSGQEEIS